MAVHRKKFLYNKSK